MRLPGLDPQYARWLRDPAWTHRLARVARIVVAGSQPIRAALIPHSRAVEVLPTAVDVDPFRPRDGHPTPVRIRGVVVECPPWQLEHEVEYFRQLDVGLDPLGSDLMSRAKHGFKLNVYRTVGVPAVASAHGAHVDTVRNGEDVLLARSPGDWYAALDTLFGSALRRRKIGGAGRR